MDEITIYDPGEITVSLDFALLLDEWHRDLEARVQSQEISADTAKGYATGAAKFLSWMKGQPTPDAIRQWKADQLAQYKPASVNAWLAGIRSFFTWLAEKGQIPFNPTQAVKGAKRKGSKKHRRQPLTDTEARAVLAQPDRTTPEGARDAAMLALMLFTAARTIELHRADVDDLQTVGTTPVIYVQGKGRTEKDEYLILPPAAETAILEWLSHRTRTPGPLFTSLSDRSDGKRLSRRAIRQIIKGRLRKAGVDDTRKTTHSLRHTAITKALAKTGGDVIKVQGMSRHASIDTLMIYQHETEREKDPAERYIEY